MPVPAQRGPVRVPAAPVRVVHVADPADPAAVLALRLRWLCPVPTCLRPRGEVERTRLAYHRRSGPPVQVSVDRWRNPCGHLDLVTEVITEAARMLDHQAAARARRLAIPAQRRTTPAAPHAEIPR